MLSEMSVEGITSLATLVAFSFATVILVYQWTKHGRTYPYGNPASMALVAAIASVISLIVFIREARTTTRYNDIYIESPAVTNEAPYLH